MISFAITVGCILAGITITAVVSVVIAAMTVVSRDAITSAKKWEDNE